MGENLTKEQRDMILYALSCLWHEIRDSEEQEGPNCTIYTQEQVRKCYADAEAMFFIYENS